MIIFAIQLSDTWTNKKNTTIKEIYYKTSSKKALTYFCVLMLVYK
jgi:hypothetical protein